MPEAEILHRLYTNAAEAGASDPAAGRFVAVERDASEVVSKEVLRALDDLLKKTSPSTTQTGWVVRRFVDGKKIYGCVIASHGDLVQAADERDGVLNHARLVAIDGPSFDASALIEAAREFPEAEVCAVPAGERLRAYVDAVSSEAATLVRPVTIGELQDAPQLYEFLLACVATLHQNRIAVKIANTKVEDLARAWAALPLALQTQTSWAAGVKDGCPVNVHFSATEGKAPSHVGSKTLNDCVKEYVRLIGAAPDTVSAFLANPELRDASAFATAVNKSALAPELKAVAGKEEMAKKRNDSWQPLDDDSRSEVNRQLKASAELLRREMDERLRTFEEKMRAQSPAQQQRNALLPMWIAIAVLLLAVLFLGYRSFTRRPPARSVDRPATALQNDVPEDEPAPRPEPDTPASSPAQQAIASAQSTGRWADEFKSLLENDSASVAALVAELAQESKSQPLASFAKRIETLTPAQRDQLRALLIDALAAKFNPKEKIDGKLADVDVAALKKEYGVTSTSNDASSKALQSEILLRWIAERER
ncbi:MAG TPA: hypothetical protein VM733_21200 [Thermoanaerobaculia bacterium]|nr:hypothetical protein [Thermoanaerobaculia bacterium]